MGLLYLILILLAIVLYTIVSILLQRRKLLRFFSNDYIDWEVRELDYDYLNFTKNYWLKSSRNIKDKHSIDDITWNDLDMDLLYSKINHTQTSCGSEILYSKLRELKFDTTSISNSHQLMSFFQSEKTIKVKSLVELSNLGNQDSLRLFDFLFEKINITKTSILPFYFLRLLFLLSVVSLVLIPTELAIIIIFISLTINIFVYYSSKKSIMKDLTAIQYLAQLVRCSQKLSVLSFPSDLNISNRLTTLTKQLKPLSKQFALSLTQSTNDAAFLAEYIKIALLIDFTTYHNAISFIQKHQIELQELYQLIGDIDSSIVLSEYEKLYLSLQKLHSQITRKLLLKIYITLL